MPVTTLYVAEDWDGNAYIVDDKDALPPDIINFHELPLRKYRGDENATLTIDVNDYSEVVSL